MGGLYSWRKIACRFEALYGMGLSLWSAILMRVGRSLHQPEDHQGLWCGTEGGINTKRTG